MRKTANDYTFLEHLDFAPFREAFTRAVYQTFGISTAGESRCTALRIALCACVCVCVLTNLGLHPGIGTALCAFCLCRCC